MANKTLTIPIKTAPPIAVLNPDSAVLPELDSDSSDSERVFDSAGLPLSFPVEVAVGRVGVAAIFGVLTVNPENEGKGSAGGWVGIFGTTQVLV